MKTDELMSVLTKANLPKSPLPLWGILTAFFAGCAILTFLVIGFRPELQGGVYPLGFWVKTSLLLSFAAATSFMLHESSLPKLFVTPKIALNVLASIVTALVVREWVTLDVQQIMNPHYLENLASCFLCVSLYGGIGAVILSRAMKNYAPLDTDKTAGLIGLAAASVGAVGYSFHCPVDSASFIVLAYGIPTAGIWALSRKFLARRLAW